MNRKKKSIYGKAGAIAVSAALLLSMAGCGAQAEASAAAVSAENTISVAEAAASSTAEVQQTVITLSDDGIQVSGKGAKVDGKVVTVKKSGTYVVSGTLTEGQLRVEKKDILVTLILNGVQISNSTEDAIFVKKAGGVTIELAEDTENVLISGTEEAYVAAVETLEADAAAGENAPAPVQEAAEVAEETEETEETSGETESAGEETENEESGPGNEAKAALFSKSDLAITGAGSLMVYGYQNNGIQTKGSLLLNAGSISVTSLNDAVKASVTVSVEEGSYTVEAMGDGVCAQYIAVSDGSLSVTTGGGCDKKESTQTESFGFPGMDFFGANKSNEESVSQKGLKAESEISVTGGTISLDAADDAVHAGGLITVAGGTLTAASGDDGIHSDIELLISDGTVQVTQSYEGLEAPCITIDGGDISVTSDDDGLNAGGDLTELPLITINGGVLYVCAEGDGIDSNGSVIINGGEIHVDGPSYTMNSPVDTGSENGGSYIINGGTLVALGTSSMLEIPESDSTQMAIVMKLTNAMEAGDEVTLTDSQGDELMKFVAGKYANSVTISSPELVQGETYTVTYGENSESLTASELITSNTNGFGFGGFGGFGGPGGPPGR